MESNTEIIEVKCAVCGKIYTVELQPKSNSVDKMDQSLDDMMRNFQQLTIDNKKCSSCIETEEAAKQERQRKIELDKCLCKIPFSTDFDSSKAQDRGVLADWIWTNRNQHLFIAGDYGCGKTRSLCHVLGRFIKQGYKCRYITCNDLLSKYGFMSSESGKMSADRWLERLLQNDVLFIDDLGKKRISYSGGEALYNLLDYRYSGRGRATIYLTANLSGFEIARKFEDSDTGAAFRSRLQRLEFLPWKHLNVKQCKK